MRKPADNYGAANASPPAVRTAGARGAARPSAGPGGLVGVPGRTRAADAWRPAPEPGTGAARCRPCPRHDPARTAPRAALNRPLRRPEPALGPLACSRRPGPGAALPGVRGSACGRRRIPPGACPPSLRNEVTCRSGPRGHALRYWLHRNGQMAHRTQVTAGLRGGVRRGAAIAAREHAGPSDQGLTTFGSITCIQSNIFGFVMT
jgi:hypothetical protein